MFSCGLAILLAAHAASDTQSTQEQSEKSEKKATPPQRIPRNAIDRWNQMSPEERERALSKLPPEKAKQIRERIQRYNALPPQEKLALGERYRRFEELPPEQQENVRQCLKDIRQMRVERRAMVGAEIRQLWAMPEDHRRARLNSDDLRSRFTPRERQIIETIGENFAPSSK
jgi:Protein of unknown function (DUF3106)